MLNFLRFVPGFAQFCLTLTLWLLISGTGYAETEPVKIGVLAKRGLERAVSQWQPTATYLSQTIPSRSFELVPLPFDQVREAVAIAKIDFLLANPAIYVEMEHDFQVSRISTMQNLFHGHGLPQFGGVIFSRADKPVNNIEDLHGKSFMAVDPLSFGGSIVAQRELFEYGFRTENDFRSVQYGRTHDAVVLAVRDSLVDVGTVRSDTLERMAQEGIVRLEDFHIFPLQRQTGELSGFPFLCSTRLYPEWPIAKLKHVPEDLAKQVSTALFRLTVEHPAARAGKVSGWTIPQNYQEVHECLRVLHLGPYSRLPKLTVSELIQLYRLEFAAILTLLLLTTGFMIYFRILGQRLKKSEYEVREAHAELDQLFHSSADGVFRVDNDCNIVRVNRTFEEMTGLSAKDVVGLKCYDVLPGSACRSSKCPVVRIAEGETQVVDESLKRVKDGKEIPCLMFAVPFHDQDGVVVGVVEYYRDISKIKQTEAELQQSRDELREAYDQLQRSQSQMLQQEKMASIGQLAAGVAHEINNPLGFIGSNLSTLKKYWKKISDYTDAQDELLAEVGSDVVKEKLRGERKRLKVDMVREDCIDLVDESLDGVDRVKTIVANLKSFSRVDQAKYIQADINQCLDSTISVIWNELKYNVELHKNYGDLPETYCYPQQLNQVFMNLLINAGHAVGDQGDVHIKTRREGDAIVIAISDSGCGIAEENLSRLFEPFFTTKDVGKGTGLGLSIAYDIVKKHDGDIQVDSQVGEGTTFSIRLPIVEKVVEP